MIMLLSWDLVLLVLLTFLKRALSIKLLSPTLHNKMELLKENTGNSFRLLGPFFSNLPFLFSFGGIVFVLLLISLTDFHLIFYIRKVLLKSYILNHLVTLILKLLDVCATLLSLLFIGTSSSLELFLLFFIGYHFDKKVYKLYNISSKTSFVSRDAVFHEHIFPFASHTGSSLPLQFFLQLTMMPFLSLLLHLLLLLFLMSSLFLHFLLLFCLLLILLLLLYLLLLLLLLLLPLYPLYYLI